MSQWNNVEYWYYYAILQLCNYCTLHAQFFSLSWHPSLENSWYCQMSRFRASVRYRDMEGGNKCHTAQSADIRQTCDQNLNNTGFESGVGG